MSEIETTGAARSRSASAPPLRLPPNVTLQHSVSSTLLTDQVFEALRDRIAQGYWAPGAPLRIREVASLMGTSEMPVREAFRRLDQAGLIVIEPYRGATVRTLSIAELEHIYDVRIMLEPEAARQGVSGADDKVLETMCRHRDLLEDAVRRGDVVEAVAQDEYLLTALYSAGENTILTELVRDVSGTCRPYKNIWVTNAVEQGLATWSHIADLLNAAERGDSEAAFVILDRTYREARAIVCQLLDTKSGHIK